jgi:hypothetical protein
VAVRRLGRPWPHSLPFDDLLREAREALAVTAAGASPEEDRQSLAQMLLSSYATTGKRLIHLSVWQPPVVREAGERPVASPLARLQARRSKHATTLSHQALTLGDFDRQVLPLLDGSRDRPALVAALVDLIDRGVLNVPSVGKKVADSGVLHERLERAVEQALVRFARTALLIA